MNAKTMSPADHAWLRMDSPENLVVIHLAFVFAGPMQLGAVRERLESRLLPFHQFTHRVQRGWLRAKWVPDEQFHIDCHVTEMHLPPGSGARELKTWMSGEACKPLDPSRPLWLATLVHGVDGRSALVMRVHHSLADGVSLMDLISGMTDIAEGAHYVAPARASQRPALTAGVVLRHAGRVAADAATMLFMRKDKPSRIKGTPGRHKSVAWSDALSLPATRDLAHRHGATVNDVMLAVIAGALRRHLHAQGDKDIAAPVRTVIPMNMRPPGESHLLGNQFGLVGLELPVHLADPLARLQAVRDGMTGLKRGFQGQLALALVRFAGVLPQFLQQAVLGIFSRRCSVIVTNVIGPAEARSVSGVRMDELMLCVPQGMTVGVGVSIISYNDQVRIGFLVDNQLMPDCTAAAAAVRTCFDQLARVAGSPTVPLPLAACEPANEEAFWPPAMALDREVVAR
jgi:diacylglycerol O-acyltransferase / wax synthase